MKVVFVAPTFRPVLLLCVPYIIHLLALPLTKSSPLCLLSYCAAAVPSHPRPLSPFSFLAGWSCCACLSLSFSPSRSLPLNFPLLENPFGTGRAPPKRDNIQSTTAGSHVRIENPVTVPGNLSVIVKSHFLLENFFFSVPLLFRFAGSVDCV